ncbi:hypothetical protein Tco_0867094 [Tanacetum coccineum]
MKADPLLQQHDIAIWLALQIKFEKTQGENSAKRQKTSEYEAYVSGESSSGQVNIEEPDIMEEISLTIDEVKLKKMADEMLRQRCTSGDEHQYHIDQMKNFLQSDIVKESRTLTPTSSTLSMEILVSPTSWKEHTICSKLWVNKCIKKFNPYARYGVENWKNPHAKYLIIGDRMNWRLPKVEIIQTKIVQVIKTLLGLGHEHKFITEIVARRANDCIVSITEPGYKNLNKNDIEDMYLLIMNNKVPDYANTRLLWSLSVFIRSSVIWERCNDLPIESKDYQTED